jgi:RNA polymerase sigma-70 factor (ECF subfamily)
MDKSKTKDRRLALLMQSTQRGDGSAYAQLLREITPLLRQVIRRQRSFLQPQDIEDLVQDTLLSLHAVRATYDPERPFLPWLMAIARNRMADSARRYFRRSAHEVTVEHPPETFSHDTANIYGETYGDPEALKQAIQGLTPGLRKAVELLKLRELSLKEAAAVSGMSISALKIAVHRAIKVLRLALKKEP